MILIGEKVQYGALWDDTDRGKGAVRTSIPRSKHTPSLL
jgi:hypothetical protein